MAHLEGFLKTTDEQVKLALHFMLVWIAHVDDEYAPSERDVIGEALKSVGEANAERLTSMAREGDPKDIALAAELLSGGLTEEGKELALELAILVAAADRRLSIGENHALRFIADVLERTSIELTRKYEEITGQSFPLPRDISRAQAWKASKSSRERAGREQADGRAEDTKGSRDSRGEDGFRSDGSASRMTAARAREILGVGENASAEEIRSAYRHLAQRTHPDRFRTLGEDAAATAQTWFRQVQSAYERLKN